ncbi:DoxX family protein [Solitalea sp. MAHUQ-68]|uniref:DoxX family protein n=1 Tax=Solitalea agri TaxID=2953739 RepID=A0A9X2FAF0_9SPHI|nr:DoxX family protein [Solitalea agri]MCO4293323.1 DoxX family protein [Solitalea agri]
MKTAVIIVRLLMGLMFLFASVTVLFHLMPQPELHGKVKIFMEGMVASGYLLMLIKITELVCAIAFLSGWYVPLATVVIFPDILNIFLFHLSIEPSGLPVAIALLIGDLFLAYAYRNNYKGLLNSKRLLTI